MTKYRLVKAEKQEGIYYTLTVEIIPGSLEKLFGAKPKEVTYHGSGTVWHQMPSFERCPGRMEGLLAGFYVKTRHEEEKK